MKAKFILTFFIILLLFSSITFAQRIAAGGGHSMVICTSGTIQSWGNNSSGQLGIGSFGISYTPVIVNSLTNVVAVAAGLDHSLALKADSTVWSWGKNINGQLGIGNNLSQTTPVQITSLSGIVAIACGLIHSYALKSDGTVYAWGSNLNGELGNGTNADSNTPVQVINLTGVTALAAGNNHILALRNDSTVWAWGSNTFGALGIGSTILSSNIPVSTSNVSRVIKISAGSDHSLALTADGAMFTWGYNYAGQLGNATTIDSYVPIQINISSDITAIAGGGNFSLALKSDSTVLSWGDNAYSQLGNGTAVMNSLIPISVTNLSNVIAIDGGLAHAMSLKSDGSLRNWGYNANAQLGNGSTNNSNVPVSVPSACLSTGIEQIRSENFQIYPTVSDGHFTINVHDNIQHNLTMHLYNYIGELLEVQDLQSNSNNINFSKYQTGVYLLRIATLGNAGETMKIIISKNGYED